jgi:hypothetical protein
MLSFPNLERGVLPARDCVLNNEIGPTPVLDVFE